MCRRLYSKVNAFLKNGELEKNLGKSPTFKFQVIMKVRSLIKVIL